MIVKSEIPNVASDSKPELVIRNLGLCDYTETWNSMRNFTLTRVHDTADEVWLLQHHAVFTQGLNGKNKHILNAEEIPIVQSDRGGQITYHGPGQLVVYFLFDLDRMGIGVKMMVRHLEQIIIDLLLGYDIIAQRLAGAPGVYIREKKIAALGLRVRKGRCYHGLSLNVNMDLSPFKRINPCGYAGMEVIQLADIDGPVLMEVVMQQLLRIILTTFDFANPDFNR